MERYYSLRSQKDDSILDSAGHYLFKPPEIIRGREGPESKKIKFSDLKVGEKIGQGGFGVVKKGWYKGEVVAIKFLSEGLSDEALSEAKMMMNLTHKSLIGGLNMMKGSWGVGVLGFWGFGNHNVDFSEELFI